MKSTGYLLFGLLVTSILVGTPSVAQEDENLVRADELYKAGKFKEALAAYEEICASSPDEAGAYTGAGKCLIALSRVLDALNLMQKAGRLPTASAETYSVLGQAYYWHAASLRGTQEAAYIPTLLQEAEASLGRAVQKDPALHLAHYYRGKVKMDQNQAVSAADSFQKAAKLKPDQASYHFELGSALMKANIMLPAARAFAAAAKRSPRKFKTYIRDAHMNAACCFGKAGNTKEAARAYKKAFLMDPKNGALFQNFWTVYGADKKRQNEGIQILKTLVAARSSAALPLYYLGFLNQALGKKAEARKAFEKVVKSKEGQKFSSAWVRLGEIYYKEDGDEKKSERHMVKALEQNPRDEKASEFLQFLATRAKNRRDMTRFVEIIKKILKYQPENGQVWNHLAWHYHSRRQLREALKYYEKAVKFAPNDAIIQTGLGKAYNDLNENAAAEACFKKAIAIDPEHVDALMNLGWFYRKHGKLEKAKALFERILEIDPGQMRIRRDLEGIKRRLEK